ncbi:MAG: CocE/NonD family hydrolase [Alteromonadaceae bacterium]|nr:CocE/NonD family hydrolase [Alteromonadaceae bacterium]
MMRITPLHALFLRLITFFILLLFRNISVQAETSFILATPESLSQAPMVSREDALVLLQKNTFHAQLSYLAQQLPKEAIGQQSPFSKMALLSVLGEHKALIADIEKLKNAISFTHYRLHSETLLQLSAAAERSFADTLEASFTSQISTINDEALYQLFNALGWSLSNAQDYAFNLFKKYRSQSALTTNEAIDLIVNAHLYRVLARVLPLSQRLIKQENQRRYVIEPEVLITTDDGVELTATVVRKKHLSGKLPTAMQFTIYADEKAHIITAIHAAAHGYVGVVANSRGKRLSNNAIVPWEHDGDDATQVIEWITEQPWSNGDVVMYGGSYNGFTQWAAAKHMHPALKAMAPYTAASLITGLPYENNIVLTGNYEWPFFVTNNKTTDGSVYSDWQKSNQLIEAFYKSGRAINTIDELDGRPNPWFQKWLAHPGFDRYYQSMVPVKDEYAQINIPVLTVTGYFDGGQISAIDYLTRHYQYNASADHTLLIGPYNHGTAQTLPRAYHSNYALDPVALEKDTEEIVFAWFDHVLFDAPKPILLKNKVNYQLMGSNQWRHRESFAAINRETMDYYFASATNQSGNFTLLTKPETATGFVSQIVDMADRTNEHNRTPWPVIQEKLNEPNGLVFMTEPFSEPMELAGAISGYFELAINKRDVDIGYNFYAIDASGEAFHLNNYRSRASYAADMSERKLLTPHQKTRVPIVNARMTAKLLAPGSRLAVVLNVNKNQHAQVNHGSGKDVNAESVADAGQPLTIKWFNDSLIRIPLKHWKTGSR